MRQDAANQQSDNLATGESLVCYSHRNATFGST
jgi:hypothetical protein